MTAATQKVKLTKKAVDAAEPRDVRYCVWDAELKGFGLQVERRRVDRPDAAKSYLLRYRLPGAGRGVDKGYLRLGRHGQVTADQAREQAKIALGQIAAGIDPALERAKAREAEAARNIRSMTLEDLGKLFIEEAIIPRRKPTTAKSYEAILRVHFNPHLGKRPAVELTRIEVTALHAKLRKQKTTANRVLAVVGSMYSFAARRGLVPEGFNPTRGIEKYKEQGRERYLTTDELKRLGQALTEAETIGVPWMLNPISPKSKHTPHNTRTLVDAAAVAALRLLIFTGARLREILHLKWEYVDLGRGLLLLPDSKTGKKAIVLNEAAAGVIRALMPSEGTVARQAYVIPGEVDGQPRTDLKRPWAAITRQADLANLRIHDLRHTFASIGAGASLGLPIVGKLLGHSQPQTTARYAHLDADPLRRAANIIGDQLTAAMTGVSAAK